MRRRTDLAPPCDLRMVHSVPQMLQNRGQKAPALQRGMNGLFALPLRRRSATVEPMNEQKQAGAAPTPRPTAAVRKTYKYKLQPTPQQTAGLEETLRLCRQLYNVALEQRRTWWGRGQGRAATHAQQEAELPDLKAALPEYAAIHSQVVQDVLTRLDRAYQAFFRRLAAGETAGFPRFRGRARYHSFTSKQFGNGATLDHGVLVLSKLGRLAVRGRRPPHETPKTVTVSRDADGWT